MEKTRNKNLYNIKLDFYKNISSIGMFQCHQQSLIYNGLMIFQFYDSAKAIYIQ